MWMFLKAAGPALHCGLFPSALKHLPKVGISWLFIMLRAGLNCIIPSLINRLI